MNISYNISTINEIRYLDEKNKLYANLEYSGLNSTIKITYNKSDVLTLIFISKDSPSKMMDFWNEIVQSSLDKKLKSLDEVINEMKKQFKIKAN